MLIGNYNAQYIGNTMCGFTNTHEYRINITKNEYGYQVSGITNLTEEKSATSAYITYASENSFRRNWIIDEDITQLEGD